jgi:hypothetical protein
VTAPPAATTVWPPLHGPVGPAAVPWRSGLLGRAITMTRATRTPGWQIGAVLHRAFDARRRLGCYPLPWPTVPPPRGALRLPGAPSLIAPTSEKRTGAAAPKPYARAERREGAEALSRMAWLGQRALLADHVRSQREETYERRTGRPVLTHCGLAARKDGAAQQSKRC